MGNDLGIPTEDTRVFVVTSRSLVVKSSAGDVNGHADISILHEGCSGMLYHDQWVLAATFLYDVKTFRALSEKRNQCIRQAQMQLFAANQYRQSFGDPPIPVFMSDHSTVMYAFHMMDDFTGFYSLRVSPTASDALSLGWGLGLMKYFASRPIPTLLAFPTRLPTISEQYARGGDGGDNHADDEDDDADVDDSDKEVAGASKGVSAVYLSTRSHPRVGSLERSNKSSPSDPRDNEHSNTASPEEEAEMECNIQQGLRAARRQFTMEEVAARLPMVVYDVGWE
jgi:hypothetical protein